MSDYEETLDRALDRTPTIDASSDRYELPTPEVRQEGHVTVFENFQAAVDRLDRDEDLVLRFLQNEVGTSAHIDESGRARLTGDFDADRIANAVEAFADAYVRCPECGLPDTRLEDQQGARVIRCEACGAISPAG